MQGKRVVVITPEALDDSMAGPAIRAWHMADVLALQHEVRLVSTRSASRASANFEVRMSDASDRTQADVVVAHPAIVRTHPDLLPTSTPLVVDLYDPFHLENLEPGGSPDGARMATVAHLNSVINDALARGDFFLCATERQRDFWLGSLTALGRVNPATYDADPTLRGLAAVAPFGIAHKPPQRSKPALRGVNPGIGADDPILLWAGGVYNWFDPVTLIEAVGLARRDVPTLRLVFLGMGHPNPDIPPMRTAAEARRRSDELELTDSAVFFNEGWVAYDERADYLLEADIGVSTHRPHIETAFSFRTRMLDYLWAGLPILTSDGDTFADLAREEDIGVVVPGGDVEALAQAIVGMLTDRPALDRYRRNVTRIAPRFEWAEVLAPLVRFCNSPSIAADRRGTPSPPPVGSMKIPEAQRRRFWRSGR